MQDLIEKLYNGEIYPAENMQILLHDYKSKYHVWSELKERFEESLPEQLKVDFNAMVLGQVELNALEMTQAFVDGYKLGAKFIIEILSEEKKDVEN